jgi:hypothetical protein
VFVDSNFKLALLFIHIYLPRSLIMFIRNFQSIRASVAVVLIVSMLSAGPALALNKQDSEGTKGSADPAPKAPEPAAVPAGSNVALLPTDNYLLTLKLGPKSVKLDTLVTRNGNTITIDTGAESFSGAIGSNGQLTLQGQNGPERINLTGQALAASASGTGVFMSGTSQRNGTFSLEKAPVPASHARQKIKDYVPPKAPTKPDCGIICTIKGWFSIV